MTSDFHHYLSTGMTAPEAARQVCYNLAADLIATPAHTSDRIIRERTGAEVLHAVTDLAGRFSDHGDKTAADVAREVVDAAYLAAYEREYDL